MDRLQELDLQDRIEEIAGPVLQKQADFGQEALSKSEKIIHAVWFANYCMMNAGDLANATDENSLFLSEAAELALELDMPLTGAAFALPQAVFEERYLELLEGIVGEIQ